MRVTARVLVLAGLLASSLACGLAPRPSLVAALPDPRSQLTVNFDDPAGAVKRISIVHPVPDWAIRPAKGITLVERDPSAVWLRWLGGDCPSDVTVSLIQKGTTSTLDVLLGSLCQHDVGVPCGLLIEFIRSQSSGSITVVTASAPPS